jgi:hypothetical protein
MRPVMRTVRYCLTLGLVSLLGCSDAGKAEVSGTVRLNGELVEEGSIQFIPVEGTKGPSAGAAIKNGKYHVPRSKGAAIGKNRVELRAFKTTGRKVQDPTAPPGTTVGERAQLFPAKYNDDSTVVKEIKPSGNIIDFDVRTDQKEK